MVKARVVKAGGAQGSRSWGGSSEPGPAPAPPAPVQPGEWSRAATLMPAARYRPPISAHAHLAMSCDCGPLSESLPVWTTLSHCQ